MRTQLLLGAISGNRAEFWTQEAKKNPIHFQNLLRKMLVLGQRPKQVSKHSSIFKPGLSLSCSKTTANINCRGKPDEFQLWLLLVGDRMDLAVVFLLAPRKKTALRAFSKVFHCLCSSLSKFLSPHPAKQSKTTSSGCSRTTFTQPGHSPFSINSSAHPADGKGA